MEELAHSRRLAKAQTVMATLTHRAHRKLEREGAMENLSSGASEAGPIEALSLRDQEVMKMEARQVVDEWLRPEFRGSAAAASHEAAWGPAGAFCPRRLFCSQLIPPVLSLFTRFRPYLGHFFPVFSRFLRVFTVSPRRFQRAQNRNPGPRNSVMGAQTPF